jgi:hypothetical protein
LDNELALLPWLRVEPRVLDDEKEGDDDGDERKGCGEEDAKVVKGETLPERLFFFDYRRVSASPCPYQRLYDVSAYQLHRQCPVSWCCIPA